MRATTWSQPGLFRRRIPDGLDHDPAIGRPLTRSANVSIVAPRGVLVVLGAQPSVTGTGLALACPRTAGRRAAAARGHREHRRQRGDDPECASRVHPSSDQSNV
jgi:hypothetical protein